MVLNYLMRFTEISAVYVVIKTLGQSRVNKGADGKKSYVNSAPKKSTDLTGGSARVSGSTGKSGAKSSVASSVASVVQ